MHGGGVCAEGGIGAGGEVFCSMQFLELINHGGCHRPKTAMRPYSRHVSIQQSADMLCSRLARKKYHYQC